MKGLLQILLLILNIYLSFSFKLHSIQCTPDNDGYCFASIFATYSKDRNMIKRTSGFFLSWTPVFELKEGILHSIDQNNAIINLYNLTSHKLIHSKRFNNSFNNPNYFRFTNFGFLEKEKKFLLFGVIRNEPNYFRIGKLSLNGEMEFLSKIENKNNVTLAQGSYDNVHNIISVHTYKDGKSSDILFINVSNAEIISKFQTSNYEFIFDFVYHNKILYFISRKVFSQPFNEFMKLENNKITKIADIDKIFANSYLYFDKKNYFYYVARNVTTINSLNVIMMDLNGLSKVFGPYYTNGKDRISGGSIIEF
jgi:hypothetical protein